MEEIIKTIEEKCDLSIRDGHVYQGDKDLGCLSDCRFDYVHRGVAVDAVYKARELVVKRAICLLSEMMQPYAADYKYYADIRDEMFASFAEALRK